LPGILALDPALVTGFAHSEPGERPTWGHQRLGASGEDTDKISEALEIFLETRIALWQPQYIVRETVYDGPNPVTNNILGGIGWQIDMQARQHRIPCAKVDSNEFIKWFTSHKGKWPGNTYEQRRAAKKRATVTTAHTYGWQCTQDEADALALLIYAEAKLFPEMCAAMRRPAGPLFRASTG
jgi:hypothetical protein